MAVKLAARPMGRRHLGVAADIEIAFPVLEYHWESHLDASLPDGARSYIPSPWLVHEVGLVAEPKRPGVWTGPDGAPAFVSYNGERGNQCVLLNKEAVDAISDDGATSMVWVMVAERNAWPGGTNTNATWRRTEGICWPKDGELQSQIWHQDNANGSSANLLRKEITVPAND